MLLMIEMFYCTCVMIYYNFTYILFSLVYLTLCMDSFMVFYTWNGWSSIEDRTDSITLHYGGPCLSPWVTPLDTYVLYSDLWFDMVTTCILLWFQELIGQKIRFSPPARGMLFILLCDKLGVVEGLVLSPSEWTHVVWVEQHCVCECAVQRISACSILITRPWYKDMVTQWLPPFPSPLHGPSLRNLGLKRFAPSRWMLRLDLAGSNWSDRVSCCWKMPINCLDWMAFVDREGSWGLKKGRNHGTSCVCYGPIKKSPRGKTPPTGGVHVERRQSVVPSV